MTIYGTQLNGEQIIPEQNLIPCSTCGRTFLPLALKKHAPVCEKNTTKKRKVFDSSKQRIEGTDLAQFHQKTYIKKPEPTKSAEKLKKQPRRWEENHQKLVDAIRSAKGASAKEMSPTRKPTQTTSALSNERCPFCERQFGPKAFDRHVEWCKEHRTRIQKSPANILLAKERLEARTKYKVPPLNKPRRLAVKEKYSTGNINRTESVCSVKSTPTNNVLCSSPSIRKPRSVLNLERKEKPIKIHKTTKSVTTLNEVKKPKQPNKNLRPKRFCPPCDKVNSSHNENLESITVSPVKLVTFESKKLVTWKELSKKTKEEPVIVVYDNSNIFENEISLSPKSKSSPEFGANSSFTYLSSPTRTEMSDSFSNKDLDESVTSKSFLDCSQDGTFREDIGNNDESSIETKDCLSDVEKSPDKISPVSSSSESVHKEPEPEIFSKEDLYRNLSADSLVNDDDDDDVVAVDSLCFALDNFSFQKQHEIADKDSGDYEVPKKRRKLNLTFVKDESGKEIQCDKNCDSDIIKRNVVLLKARRRKKKESQNVKISKQIKNVFLSYKSSNSPQPYDPFLSAEKQFMELLECSDFKSVKSEKTARPYTAAVDNPIKVSAKKIQSAGLENKKRTSVIDPPVCFQDPADDDFEILENLINNQYDQGDGDDDFYLSLDKRDKEDFNVILNQRAYSDDLSSIDSNLINENDDLTIPEHFKSGDYSPTDTDTTLQNDTVDLYSLQCERRIEKVKKNKNKTTPTRKSIKNTSAKDNKTKDKGGHDNVRENKIDVGIKAEELFDVDDKMYAEYKIYEEMYLKEKEQLANTKKARIKNSIKSYGIEMGSSESHASLVNKISDDSAYGSLNRNTPEPNARKTSPLRNRINSESSSGSENLASPICNQRMSKFCHECGNKYPLTTAKFCVECGVKRLLL